MNFAPKQSAVSVQANQGKGNTMLFGNDKVIAQFRQILGRNNGGVYKRIDENRELLELLQREAPDFLAKHFEVVGWLKSQDEFLRELEAVAPLTDVQFPQRTSPSERSFPRPWPMNANA